MPIICSVLRAITIFIGRCDNTPPSAYSERILRGSGLGVGRRYAVLNRGTTSIVSKFSALGTDATIEFQLDQFWQGRRCAFQLQIQPAGADLHKRNMEIS